MDGFQFLGLPVEIQLAIFNQLLPGPTQLQWEPLELKEGRVCLMTLDRPISKVFRDQYYTHCTSLRFVNTIDFADEYLAASDHLQLIKNITVSFNTSTTTIHNQPKATRSNIAEIAIAVGSYRELSKLESFRVQHIGLDLESHADRQKTFSMRSKYDSVENDLDNRLLDEWRDLCVPRWMRYVYHTFEERLLQETFKGFEVLRDLRPLVGDVWLLELTYFGPTAGKSG